MNQTFKRSTLFVSMLVAAWSLMHTVALAQATCTVTVNGQEVPCAQAGASAGGIFALSMGFMLVFFAIGIASFVFWIMMIVHAASNPIENKAMWIVLMALTGIIGAIVYYFAVKRNFNRQPPAQFPQPPQSNAPTQNP